jgi:hypothetical protein
MSSSTTITHASTSAPADVAQDASSGPAAMVVSPPSVGATYAIPFSFELSMDTPEIHFFANRSTDLLRLCTFFESVQLESFAATFTILPGVTRRVDFAFTAEAGPHADLDWQSQPVAGIIAGAKDFTIRESVVLPSDHSFGREIKGLNVGNPPPRFRALYTGGVAGSDTHDVVVRCVIRIRCSGTGVITGW